MDQARRWLTHTVMSEPGQFAGAVALLPADPAELVSIVQHLLVHTSWLMAYGLVANADPSARTTLPVRDRLANVLMRDGQPLDAPRPPDRRSRGTCRDFALLLCAFLRTRGTPARVRCGFARYLFPDRWEDHWVCEHWDAKTETWRLADAQVDDMLRQQSDIAFDPADIPRDMFMTAGEAWLSYRRGTINPTGFGHGETTGAWFLKVNLLRDHYVLNGRETSAWDRWREAPPAARIVPDGDVELLGTLAWRPDQPLIELQPGW